MNRRVMREVSKMLAEPNPIFDDMGPSHVACGRWGKKRLRAHIEQLEQRIWDLEHPERAIITTGLPVAAWRKIYAGKAI